MTRKSAVFNEDSIFLIEFSSLFWRYSPCLRTKQASMNVSLKPKSFGMIISFANRDNSSQRGSRLGEIKGKEVRWFAERGVGGIFARLRRRLKTLKGKANFIYLPLARSRPSLLARVSISGKAEPRFLIKRFAQLSLSGQFIANDLWSNSINLILRREFTHFCNARLDFRHCF